MYMPALQLSKRTCTVCSTDARLFQQQYTSKHISELLPSTRDNLTNCPSPLNLLRILAWQMPLSGLCQLCCSKVPCIIAHGCQSTRWAQRCGLGREGAHWSAGATHWPGWAVGGNNPFKSFPNTDNI